MIKTLFFIFIICFSYNSFGINIEITDKYYIVQNVEITGSSLSREALFDLASQKAFLSLQQEGYVSDDVLYNMDYIVKIHGNQNLFVVYISKTKIEQNLQIQHAKYNLHGYDKFMIYINVRHYNRLDIFLQQISVVMDKFQYDIIEKDVVTIKINGVNKNGLSKLLNQYFKVEKRDDGLYIVI